MVAMLDRATEDALYEKFAAFFRVAEEERAWNLWTEVPWEQTANPPSAALTEAVEAAYADELFLPDYAEQMLSLVRSSRGRAWFMTRWTYEEGKHILALGEWLMRSGQRSDAALKAFSDDLLAGGRWTLPFTDPSAAMVYALVREQEEIERYRALRSAAEAENDGALGILLRHILSDEQAHRDFLRDALRTIQGSQPALIEEAARRVAASRLATRFAPVLRADFGLDGAAKT